MKRLLPLFLLLLLLPSCGALAALQQGRSVSEVGDRLGNDLTEFQERVNEGFDEVRDTMAELQEKYEATKQQADLNKDGEVKGWDEQLMWILLGGGGLAEMLRRKLKSQDQKHEVANARIDHEREKRKDAEVALLKAQLEAASKS